MGSFHFAAERLVAAPPEVVYHCLADYREHHNTSGFLPAAFTSLEVLAGGVGAGTIIRFTTAVGGRAVTRTQQVSEPQPGRTLVESGSGEGSTFIVEPHGDKTLVRIETTLQTHGIEGLLMKLIGRRILRPIYDEELQRLERHAQEHGPLHAPEVPRTSERVRS